MMRTRISCADAYEAQKLAGLVYPGRGEETYVREVLNVIENEIIVSGRDKAAHSIMLADRASVDRFVDFVQSVLEGEHRITGTAIGEDDGTVEITKE